VDQNGDRSQWHSVYGTITVDTQPPGPVSELLLMGTDARGVVSWKASNSVDTAGYQVTLQGEGEKTIIKKTTNTRLKLTSLTNFIDYHVSVVALDEAQNQSPAVSSRFKPVPDVSMAHAVALTEFPKRLRQASVLTKENSPYKLDHALSISESAVLFIEPGVKIQTTANASITVKGEIAAFGTRKRPIVINTTGTKLYNPFIVLDSDMPSTLQGMKISGMGVTIDVKQGDHLIEDCQLLSSSLSAIIIGGSATPILKNNVIADSNASGVVISAEAKPRFVGNRFSNNRPFQIQSSSIHQVDARNSQWQPQASTITVLGNVLY
jgi:parallel beta-helix repeat protein